MRYAVASGLLDRVSLYLQDDSGQRRGPVRDALETEYEGGNEDPIK